MKKPQEVITVPAGTEISISGARFIVGTFDKKKDVFLCNGRKTGVIPIKRHLVEEAYADHLATGTKQIQRATGNQRFIRTDTNDDEEATYPRS